MSKLFRASMPACFASSDPLPHAAESAVDCSLHRPMASTKVITRWSQMAQSRPMVPTIETAAEGAAAGPHGSAQVVSFYEGRRLGRPWPQPRRCRPPLDPLSSLEVLGSCRTGLSIPTDGLVDERAAGRADHGQGAAKLVCSFWCMWCILTYFCTCRICVYGRH